MCGFVGSILPYKQVPLLARCFAELLGDDLRLVIAGSPQEGEDAAIRAINDPRILYRPGFVPDSELQLYHRSADRIVLPYQSIQNSGSAILALSFDVPVLVPNLGAMPELAALTGDDWVQTYDGQLTPEVLADALSTSPGRARPNLSDLDWQVIGQQTAQFFEDVVALSPQPYRSRQRRSTRNKRRARQRRRG